MAEKPLAKRSKSYSNITCTTFMAIYYTNLTRGKIQEDLQCLEQRQAIMANVNLLNCILMEYIASATHISYNCLK